MERTDNLYHSDRKPSASISVIIPTWNRADLLRSVLENLSEQSRPPDQIIVVDNGSTDETARVATEHNALLISLRENLGFASAVNAGLREITGDWVLIINNDVMLEREWLRRTLTAMEKSGAVFGTGKLLRTQDHRIIDGTWDLVSRAAYAWRCGNGRPDSTVWSTAREIWLAPMTAVLMHRCVFEQVGDLESRFESYYEDVDFGIRCTLRGLRGIYEPEAIAFHVGRASSGKHSWRVMYLTARNQLLLLAKHYPNQTLRRFAWPILVGQLLGVLAAAKHGSALPALAGKIAGLAQWRKFRKLSSAVNDRVSSTAIQDRIESAFAESELQIRSLQKQIGFDLYWQLYFTLVRSPARPS
jgi:GT2 family glycosyltransferase